ncbi:hypothetical protein D3C72_1197230 [compost metagenome]
MLEHPPAAIGAALGDVAAGVADPQRAGPVHEQGAHAVIAQARLGAAVEHGEIQAVVAHQAFPGGEPQVAFRGLRDVAQRVVRQTIARGPHVDGVVAQRRRATLRGQWRGNRQQQPQQTHLQQATDVLRVAPRPAPARPLPAHQRSGGGQLRMPVAAADANRDSRTAQGGMPAGTGRLIGRRMGKYADDRANPIVGVTASGTAGPGCGSPLLPRLGAGRPLHHRFQPAFGAVAQPQPAAVLFGQRAGDGQAQASTAGLART